MSEAQTEQRQAANIVTSETLADFQAQKLGLADQAPKTEKTSSGDSEPAEQSEQVAQDDASANGERKNNPKLERRFSELTKQREQAKAEAQREREQREQLEARLMDLEGRAAPKQAQQQPQEPKPEQFRDMYEYAKALAEYTAEQKIQQMKQAEVQQKLEAERQQVIQTWAERVNQAKAELPDFDDMVASSDVSVSDDIRDAIVESDVGPQLLYYLAENTDFAKKLSNMSARSALKELGKLEARLEKKADKAEKSDGIPLSKVAQSKAPPPINPIRGGATGKEVLINARGEFQGSFAEYKAARAQGRIR